VRARRLWMWALLMVAGPATAFGQDVTIGAGGFAPAYPRVQVPPDATFPSGSGGGASVSFGSWLGTAGASIRFPIRPRLWLEAEWIRAAGSGRRSFERSDFSNTPGVGLRSRTFITAAESRATNVVGVNLLRPVGTRPVSTVFGVGAAIQRTDATLEYSARCEPVAPGGCPGGTTETHVRFGVPMTGSTWQALMGIDAAMTDRASLLLNVRWMQLGEKSYDDGKGTGFAIDARVRLHRKPRAHSSEPPRNLRDGTLIGLVAGGLVGVMMGSIYEEEGRLIVPMFSMGIGTGVGLLLGALWR
jgi:hypothetical protein